jgi:hypothetical protein
VVLGALELRRPWLRRPQVRRPEVVHCLQLEMESVTRIIEEMAGGPMILYI